MKAAIRGASKETLEVMNFVERSPVDVTEEDLETKYVDWTDNEQIAGELYDLLCSLTVGEALTLVRTVTWMNGFVAWRALYKRFNPITPARCLSALLDVICPVRIMDVTLIPKAIDSWTMKVATLEREHNETLSGRMKFAIMLSFLPTDLQDIIYQQADNVQTFEQARDKIKSVVNNRIARNQPIPMDVGGVGDGQWENGEVNYSGKGGKSGGKGTCHNCGHPGHFARECPKGKGKGKGYKGTCWTCGEEGHPARDCPKGAKGGWSWKGKGAKGKGKGAWWGKGVYGLEGEEVQWEWDKDEEDTAKEIGAIDYENQEFLNTIIKHVNGPRRPAPRQQAQEDGTNRKNTLMKTSPEAPQVPPVPLAPARRPRIAANLCEGFGVRACGTCGGQAACEQGCGASRKAAAAAREPAGKAEVRDWRSEMASQWRIVPGRGRWAKVPPPATIGPPCGMIGSVDPDGRSLEVNQIARGWERIRVQVDSGAVDTVAPKEVAKAFSLRETAMSKNNIGFVAANGSKIDNYGERKVVGYTDDGEGVSMRMTCADVQKVLGSVHRMNLGGNRVMLDGNDSYLENRKNGRRTPIKYENGQYVLYMWVPAMATEAEKTKDKIQNTGNRYAILATDEQVTGFPRQARA